MFSAAILLLLPISMCLAAPAVTEDQLRSLIQPLLDFSKAPKTAVDTPPLFSSLAAVSPLDSLVLDTTQTTNTANTANTATGQLTQISPANQQLANLNLAGGLTNLITTALGSLGPAKETAPAGLDPLFGSSAGSGLGLPIGGVSRPIPAPARPSNNMFNPFSFLFPGMGGGSGSPFGMMNMSMMMRMMENMMEMFGF